VDPEDIQSEALFSVRDKCSDHDPEEISVYAWLYRNVLDCLISAWRSGNAAGRSLKREIPWPQRSSVELGVGLVGSNTSPSEAFARNELREKIAWAVGQLKPDGREILGMRHFDELSYHEVAAILGISEDAPLQRYVRALRPLKRLWKEAEGK
jgi:RNA polymerase sigma-70 factor (ECF subfamily)